MSPSTRSSALDNIAIAALLAALMAAGSARAAGSSPALPPEVTAIAPGLALKGGGAMSFFGLDVYSAWYWTSASGWPGEGPYAIDIVYDRDFEGARIARRSVDEIATLGYGTPGDRAKWGAIMAKVFPDVRRGDRLTGVTVGRTVRYFHNGVRIGDIDEPGFARAFFGIWLDPASSRPDFRAKLVGTP